jgi:hypothetical protein
LTVAAAGFTLATMSKKTSKASSKKVVASAVAAKVGRASAAEAPGFTEADVAVRAYEIYLSEGRPEGRHLEHWQRATVELGLV